MKVKINENIFNVKALTDKKNQSVGMMGKKFNKGFEGLLFLMGGKKQCFWMKNCIIPLDIIFIDGDVITKIHHSCTPCKSETCKSYSGEGNFILEVEGGTCKELGIKKGDVVTFPL